jgi:hypothetical protein
VNRFVIIGSMSILGAGLAACDIATPPPPTAAEAARSADVAKEEREGATEIQREQQDVAAQRRDVVEAAANRDYEVAVAEAEGDYKVAKERCDALSGNEQSICVDQARSVLESAKSRAVLLKPKE